MYYVMVGRLSVRLSLSWIDSGSDHWPARLLLSASVRSRYRLLQAPVLSSKCG